VSQSLASLLARDPPFAAVATLLVLGPGDDDDDDDDEGVGGGGGGGNIDPDDDEEYDDDEDDEDEEPLQVAPVESYRCAVLYCSGNEYRCAAANHATIEGLRRSATFDDGPPQLLALQGRRIIGF
jgi:hypothetical protein